MLQNRSFEMLLAEATDNYKSLSRLSTDHYQRRESSGSYHPESKMMEAKCNEYCCLKIIMAISEWRILT